MYWLNNGALIVQCLHDGIRATPSSTQFKTMNLLLTFLVYNKEVMYAKVQNLRASNYLDITVTCWASTCQCALPAQASQPSKNESLETGMVGNVEKSLQDIMHTISSVSCDAD